MRSYAVLAAMIMLVLLLLYGGLNLVERGMAQMLARDRLPEAFTVRRGAGSSVLVTFSGRTVVLDPNQAITAVKNWWERLRSD
jgi:hypothetical protein